MRRAVARPAGGRDLLDEVARFEDGSLSDARKAALHFTDAFLVRPGGFGPNRRSELLRLFSPEQVLELLFKVMWWSSNKPLVALRLDDPIDPETLTGFDYDEHGALVVHGAAP
jgi:alkylhydroperoxidase family enzyme